MAATAQGKVQLVADTKRFPRAPSAFRWVRAFGNWGITWSQWNLVGFMWRKIDEALSRVWDSFFKGQPS